MENLLCLHCFSRAHTIAHAASEGRLFVFGLGDNGQLGTGDAAEQFSPLAITPSFLRPSSTVVCTVTGGDACFVVVKHSQVRVICKLV